MYTFARLDAIRSFREAWKRDPDCAICYWGEGWAWGSYLNGPMSADQSPFAYYASQRAMQLMDTHATAREKAFIQALSVRYVKDFDAAKRKEQDTAYTEAMRKLAEAYPDDLDAVTLYADALFLLEPRRGTRDVEAPNIKRLHGVLESVLAKDPKHPGACHLYVHATESTVRPDKAVACAEFLGQSIPGASHINHMPSHTWNEVGRWGDSVRANLDAWHSDQKADLGEGFAIYPDHNLHMLLYAASMDGQGAIAVQAGKDYSKRTNDSMYQVLTLIRFGRFDEVIEVSKRPEREVNAAAWDFAQGYAKLKLKEADFAKVYLDRMKKTAETSKQEFRSHPAKRLIGVLTGILEGEIALTAGDLPKAIALFEEAVKLDDELEYRRAGAVAVPRASLAWRGVARGQAPAGCRAGLSRGSQGSSAQWMVAAGIADGDQGAGQISARSRRRSREELVAIRYLDPRVTLLASAHLSSVVLIPVAAPVNRPSGQQQALERTRVSDAELKQRQSRPAERLSVRSNRHGLPRSFGRRHSSELRPNADRG